MTGDADGSVEFLIALMIHVLLSSLSLGTMHGMSANIPIECTRPNVHDTPMCI